MKFVLVSSAEYTYPDILEYQSGSSRIDVFTARNSYATFQIILSEVEKRETEVEFEGLPEKASPDIYTLRSVQVERNEQIQPSEYRPHYPERVAPYRIYDCLRTFDGTLELTDGCGGLYVAIKADRDAVPGVYDCGMRINDISIPMTLQIYNAVVPEESLTMINGYYANKVCEYHGVAADSQAYYALEKKYLQILRRMHQNMMYTCGITYKVVGENQYEFDFGKFVDQVKRFEIAGMRYFNAPTVGHRKSWKESTILVGDGIPAMSYEGYCFLTQYLPALKRVLDENGWTDRFVMGVSDEPNDANCTEYRALCGLIHRIVPEIRLCDAMSYGNLYGALDVWVPLNSEYDKHRAEFETFRAAGAEIWHYVCCNPREPGYINRFMDYPLLSTRYLHWGNYKYDLTGYLHWAANCWQPGQNPFEQSCPEHHNTDTVCYLPAGDTHLMYPGTDGPWMSIRLEAERESAEEYELLKALSKADKAKADAICGKVFRSFSDVEYDVNIFNQTRRELLESLS